MFKRTLTAVLLSLAVSTPIFAAQPGRGDDSPIGIIAKVVKKVTRLVIHILDDGGYEITVPKP